MKTYISGPLAGAPHVSREEKEARFRRAAEVLTDLGREPLDPNSLAAECGKTDCGDTNGHSWDCWLRWDLLGMLQECDSIAMLPDWPDSKGARLELHVAQQLGWTVIDLTENPRVLNGYYGEDA